MKRKLLISLLSIACASTCAAGLVACAKNPHSGNTNTGSVDNPAYVRPDEKVETKLSFDTNENGTYTIIGRGAEDKTDIRIPAMIGEIPVTEIAESAFSGNTDLTSITIDNGIEIIGANAFSGCTNIKSIRIPDSVTTIGNGAFQSCISIVGATLGNHLTAIPEFMFENCKQIRSIIIPDSVKSIGEGAFQGCENLNHVEMGSGVLTIGRRAFYLCKGLVNITVGESVTRLESGVFEQCTSLNSVTIPNSVRFMGINLFTGCENIKTISVPYIGAFRYNDPPEDLKNQPPKDEPTEGEGEGEEDDGGNHNPIDIKDPTTYGHFGYFFGATNNRDNRDYLLNVISDVTVIITDSAPITNGAFNNAWGVTSIIIKGNVTEIMEQGCAFMWELKTLVLPKSMRTIGDSAFWSTDGPLTIYFDGAQAEWNISVTNSNNQTFSGGRKYYSGQWHYNEKGMPVAG